MDEGIQMGISVFEALVALANLIVIIVFTMSERKEKKEREKQEEEARRQEKNAEIQQKRKEIIYSRVIAGRLCEIMDKYFDNSTKMVEDIMCIKYPDRTKQMEPLSEEFRSSKRIFKHTILSVMNSLNKTEAEKVQIILEKYEDEMMEAFQKNFVSGQRVIQDIDKCRVDIMKILLQMELQI